jgi:hypothetical protein
LADAGIDAIRAGRPDPVLTPAQQAEMAFADDVVLNVRASDATLAAVRGFWSDRALVDLILVIGLYMTVSRARYRQGSAYIGAGRYRIRSAGSGVGWRRSFAESDWQDRPRFFHAWHIPPSGLTGLGTDSIKGR